MARRTVYVAQAGGLFRVYEDRQCRRLIEEWETLRGLCTWPEHRWWFEHQRCLENGWKPIYVWDWDQRAFVWAAVGFAAIVLVAFILVGMAKSRGLIP